MTTRRKLAAPFQGKPEGAKQVANHQDKIEVVDGFVNFRNFAFPPLESLRQLKFNKYCGPTPESNWVIPGVLLVGAYPASEDDDDTFDLITSILKHGITKFVCLQSEYQAGVNREVWQAGGALRPYFEDVEAIVSQKDTIPELDGIKIVDSARLSFDHCPIIDCGVTDDSKVLALAQKLTKDISEGEVIYLHCWGGHGRTGTVVCIMLYLLYGYNAKQAFDYCQAVHDLRTCPVEVGSPQTQTQRQQVVRVINSLMHEYEVRRARCEEEMRKNAQLQKQVEEEALQAEIARKSRDNAAIEHANAHVPSPAAVPMKPNLVVRDTTQEHIFSMEKNSHSISVAGAGGSLAYNAKLGRKVHNNLQQANGHTTGTHTGHTAHNAYATNGAHGKAASLPAIQSKTPPGTGKASPDFPSSDPHNSHMHHRESPPTVAGIPSNATTGASPQKGLSESGAQNLLQSLQAHPPRSPAPHNPRTEGLHKLHSRGTLSAPSSGGNDLHPSDVYIPRSSDEGEDTNDEDEGGFLMVSSAPGARIPLHTHASKGPDRINMHIHVPDMEDPISPTSPMEMSPSLSSMNGSGHGGTGYSLGYISSSNASCASRPMSVVQDSPLAHDHDEDLDLAATTSLTTEVMVMDLVTDQPPGAASRTSTSTTVVPDHHRPSLEIDESNLDDMGIRAPSSVDHPESRSQSTDSTPKQRRLSGKSISNAFKAGIKILTGGGSTPRSKKEKTANGGGELSNCSSNDSFASAGASAVTPSHGGSSKPSALLIQSLKTASTESASSFAHSPSHSNASTPTNHVMLGSAHGAGNGDVLEKTTSLMGSVDPTPPKGHAPAARPQHGSIPK